MGTGMLPKNETQTFIPYAGKADPEMIQSVPEEYQEQGVKPLDSLPAQYWNWMWNKLTTQFNLSVITVTSILTELQNVLKLAGIDPDEAKEDQLSDAIKKLTKDVIGDFADLDFSSDDVKTVVDALNALYDTIKNDIDRRLQEVEADVAAIESKIPDAASTTNKLVDEAFVLRHVATNTANFRGEWTTWGDVPTDGSQYPIDYAGNHDPTENDYMVVRDASGYGSGTTSLPINGTTITFETEGLLLAPYTTYCSITTTPGTDKVYIRAAPSEPGINLRYYIDSLSSVQDLDFFTVFPYTAGWNSIAVDPASAHTIVLCYNPGEYDGPPLSIEYAFNESASYKGPWQFKYTGDWDKQGKAGWKPEFSLDNVNLNDEQMAAINSGVTANKVSKLDASGNYTGNLATSKLTGTIGTSQIADGAVTTAKIPNQAITADKIADGVIPSGGANITYAGTKYSNMAVTSSNGVVTFNFT